MLTSEAQFPPCGWLRDYRFANHSLQIGLYTLLALIKSPCEDSAGSCLFPDKSLTGLGPLTYIPQTHCSLPMYHLEVERSSAKGQDVGDAEEGIKKQLKLDRINLCLEWQQLKKVSGSWAKSPASRGHGGLILVPEDSTCFQTWTMWRGCWAPVLRPRLLAQTRMLDPVCNKKAFTNESLYFHGRA